MGFVQTDKNGEERIIFPKVIGFNKGNGKISGVEEFPRTPIVLEWNGSGIPPYVLFDCGNKFGGLTNIKSSKLEGHSGGGLKCLYGTAPEATIFKFYVGCGNWQSEELTAYRYIKLMLPEEYPCPTKVRIESLYLVRTDYPLVRTGSFSCNDELFNEIWIAGVNTVQRCVQPNYLAGYASHYHPENREWLRNWKSIHSPLPYTIWDGLRRDREAWLGDAYFGAFTFLYAGGDPSPVLNNFELWSELQEPDGELIASAFSRQKITEYNMWFAPALDFYIQVTGDTKTAARYYHTFHLAQEWILRRIDSRNLFKVSNPTTWQYTIRRDGVITYLQGVLYKNLLSASSIEKAFGNEKKAKFYLEKAQEVKAAINRYLWNDSAGYYETSIEGKRHFEAIAQDGNVLCLLCGIADGNKRERVRNFLKEKCWTPFGSATYDQKIPADSPGVFANSNWAHNRNIWIYDNVLQIEALLISGFEMDAFELAKRCYGNMLKHGPGTFWEMADSSDGSSPTKPFFSDVYNSCCHAWGSYISYLLQARVAGIMPSSPGFSSVFIKPIAGGLREISASIPTPRGIISVNYEIKEHIAKAELRIPEGIHWQFDGSMLKSDKIELIVNGKKENI